MFNVGAAIAALVRRTTVNLHHLRQHLSKSAAVALIRAEFLMRHTLPSAGDMINMDKALRQVSCGL